jgi:hypothetical protein
MALTGHLTHFFNPPFWYLIRPLWTKPQLIQVNPSQFPLITEIQLKNSPSKVSKFLTKKSNLGKDMPSPIS